MIMEKKQVIHQDTIMEFNQNNKINLIKTGKQKISKWVLEKAKEIFRNNYHSINSTIFLSQAINIDNCNNKIIFLYFYAKYYTNF